ncbi:hypothetical protein [Hyphomicrobium sp.]|uniref:hypothetical protein n=1 Tax=Hyphomicrobium sp. TaxID=82 RepID=UPI0025B9104E|nr:hypothetical protein [Hyphomicrobium sp.]
MTRTVLPLIAILVIFTITIAAAVLAPRLVPRHVRLADDPDRPRAFGHDMAWLAIRSDDSSAVAAALGLGRLQPANWSSGIGAIYDPEISSGLVFISPPVKGWTLVAAESLPVPAGGAFVDKMMPLLRHLASTFPAVQYFAAFPIIDTYAWARFERGRRVRAFAVGDGGVIWNAGKPSQDERRLGLSYIEIRGIRERHGDLGGELQLYPTDQHVFAVAGGWSINPMAVELLSATSGVGWVADAPRAWRPERIRKVA